MSTDQTAEQISSSIRDTVESVRSMLTVERVVGQPIERNGVTVVPVVAIRGGVGGGGGEGRRDTEEQGTGAGGGFGIAARPVGAYVIRNDEVDWKPAVDPSRVAVVVVAVAFLVTRVLRAIFVEP
jgi:uncharacterized spore protein YtfJ